MGWFQPGFSDAELRVTALELEKRQLVTQLIHAFRYNLQGRIAVLLKRLEKMSPESTEFYYFRALQEYRRDEKGKAWFLLEKSLTKWPEYARAWNLRGILLGESGRNEEALLSFEKALHWAPFNPVYLYNTASLLYRTGQYKKAEARIAEALKAKINLAEGYYLQGLIHREQQAYQKALRSFSDALHFGYRTDPFLLEFARLALKTGDTQKQTELLAEIQKIRDPKSHLLQAQIHEGFAEYTKAALALGRVCRNPKASTPQLRRRYMALLARTGLNARRAVARLPVKPEERAELLRFYEESKTRYQKAPSMKDAILKPF